MAFKRVHSEEEIATLAEQLRSLRVSGDAIRPWFRQNRDVFLNLVHSTWSWAAIARALTKAEITYGTGKPWTALWLQADFWRAQAPLKGYAKRSRNQKPMPPVRAVVASQSTPPDPPHVAPGAHHGEQTAKPAPRFKPVSIKPFEPRQPPTEEELAQIERNRMHAFGRR